MSTEFSKFFQPFSSERPGEDSLEAWGRIWEGEWAAFVGPEEKRKAALLWGRVNSDERADASLRTVEKQASREMERRLSQKLAGAVSLTSLSHCWNRDLSPTVHGIIGIACQTLESGPIRRIGVDLESARRAVSQRVAERIIRAQEGEAFRKWLTPLDFWVIKEAAFKATPDNEGALVSGNELLSWDAARGEGVICSDRLERQSLICRVKRIETPDWKLAFAYSRERLE